MSYLSIETSQNVEIEHNIAGIGDRIAAQLIDYLVYGAYIILLIMVQQYFDIFSNTISIIAVILPLFFYPLLMEMAYDGQTVGKMLLKIKVVRLNGMPVSFSDYLLRWLLVIVDIRLFSGIIAIVTILINGKGQRLGDMAAGTTVVSLRNRVSLNDTMFSEINEEYELHFPEVEMLDSSDIEVIKDVLGHVRRNNLSQESVEVAYRAKQALEDKMGIKSDMKASDFFRIILKDYNYYSVHNSLSD